MSFVRAAIQWISESSSSAGSDSASRAGARCTPTLQVGSSRMVWITWLVSNNALYEMLRGVARPLFSPCEVPRRLFRTEERWIEGKCCYRQIPFGRYTIIRRMFLNLWQLHPSVSGNTDMLRLTTGILSEKCVFRRFRRCANVIERTYTNLDRTV